MKRAHRRAMEARVTQLVERDGMDQREAEEQAYAEYEAAMEAKGDAAREER